MRALGSSKVQETFPRNGWRAVLCVQYGGEGRLTTLPSLMLQCSTAWPFALTPATGTLYHELCSPKSCKPLLMPASHPETPPGCPRAHVTHPCHLLHSSFLLLPQRRHMSNPPVKRMGQQRIAQGQGVRVSLGRLDTAARLVLARAGCL